MQQIYQWCTDQLYNKPFEYLTIFLRKKKKKLYEQIPFIKKKKTCQVN